jgi:hypothetical protein
VGELSLKNRKREKREEISKLQGEKRERETSNVNEN